MRTRSRSPRNPSSSRGAARGRVSARGSRVLSVVVGVPVVAAGLCVALAAPAGAVEDGTYLVKDAVGGQCLAGTALAPCGAAGTEWSLRHHDDGTVQFAEDGGKGRCLALPVALSYPAALHLNTCGPTTDRWRIEGPEDGPVTIAHAYPPTGRLAAVGGAVHVSNNSSVTWVLQRVGG